MCDLSENDDDGEPCHVDGRESCAPVHCKVFTAPTRLDFQSCVLFEAPVHLTDLPLTKPISSTTFPSTRSRISKNQGLLPLTSSEATVRERPLRNNVGKQKVNAIFFFVRESRGTWSHITRPKFDILSVVSSSSCLACSALLCSL